MLVIRNEQFAALREPAFQQFEVGMLQHLQRYFPVDCALLNETQLRTAIRAGMRAALACAFTEQGQVCRYIDLTLCLGAGFIEDPLLPWAAACIAEGNGEPGTFERLHEAALSHIEAVSGASGQYALRAILKARTLDFAEAADEQADHGELTLRLLRRLWPQKFRRLRVAGQTEFLGLADRLARADNLDAPGPRQLYTILMFLLGSGFAHDPTLPWAEHALGDAAPAAPMERARSLYEAGMAAIDHLKALLPQPEAA